jgi:hypothetical protein
MGGGFQYPLHPRDCQVQSPKCRRGATPASPFGHSKWVDGPRSKYLRTHHRATPVQRLTALLILSWCFSLSIAAEGEATPVPPPETALQNTHVYLLIFGPGEKVLSRFGHSALWVRTPESDLAYNFGLSAVQEPRFMHELIQGRVLSSSGGKDPYVMIRNSITDGRSVRVAELSLTSSEKTLLLQYLAARNGQYYEQDFYLENCSTGIRDALNFALAGQLHEEFRNRRGGATYRTHSLRYAASDLRLHFALQAIMGPSVDGPLSAWEEMFTPDLLLKYLRTFPVEGGFNRPEPLVRWEGEIFSAQATPVSPPRRWPLYLAIGCVVLLLFMISITILQEGFLRSITFHVPAILWSAGSGLVGLTILTLWLLTDQRLVAGNLNLLQLQPISLCTAWLLLTGGSSSELGRRLIKTLIVASAALSLFGLAVALLPGPSQANADIILLALPSHLGLALGFARRYPFVTVRQFSFARFAYKSKYSY